MHYKELHKFELIVFPDPTKKIVMQPRKTTRPSDSRIYFNDVGIYQARYVCPVCNVFNIYSY